jgi:hypothetical protein
VLGLYDHSGMLRYAGPGRAECLAYAELFGLGEGSFSLEPLLAAACPAAVPDWPAVASDLLVPVPERGAAAEAAAAAAAAA